MKIQEILNFRQIDATTASGGQPSEAQFQDARNQGYELVINLAPDGLETSLPDEAALLAALELEYHHIPVPWAAPAPDQLDEFIALMEKSAGRRILIHCQANFRVTAFYALYAMAKRGWRWEQAKPFIDSVWTSRPGFEMDDTWKRFIDLSKQRLAVGTPS